ncbi:MAG: type II toxin-antitoxin system Phd/YefM family antitoxin [Armatimonadota bacterium]
MVTVGIRELKNDLSRYLKRVRHGEMIVVTDRGEPVARVIPMGVAHDIARLIADGRVTWSGRRFIAPGRLIRPKPGLPFSQYVGEDRF